MNIELKDLWNAAWLLLSGPLIWIWNRVQKDIADVAANLEKHVAADRVDFVTKEAYQHHNDTLETTRNIRSETVDRELAERKREIEAVEGRRRDGDTELHARIDSLKDDMNRGFQETQRLIMERMK